MIEEQRIKVQTIISNLLHDEKLDPNERMMLLYNVIFIQYEALIKLQNQQGKNAIIDAIKNCNKHVLKALLKSPCKDDFN